MNRKELVRLASGVMRENNIRKPIYTHKQVFHISDDAGNKKDFVIKQKDSSAMYTIDDIDAVLDACIYVIQEALKRGETITVRGFGTLGLNYRKARMTKHPATGEPVDIDAHYVPKFISGNDLKMCAKVYELSIDEKVQELPPLYDEEGDG